MDPHKRSATIEVMTGEEIVVGGARSAPTATATEQCCSMRSERAHQAGQDAPKFPDLLKQDFTADRPNTRWAT
jgi:hypothetical protein